MSTRAEELRAELAVAEREEEFLEAKQMHADGDLSDEEYRAIKQGFHDARVAYRQMREAAAAQAVTDEAAGGDEE